MKTITHFIAVFALCLSPIISLEAGSWATTNRNEFALTLVDTLITPHQQSWTDPKDAKKLINLINNKIRALNNEKAKLQSKLADPNATVKDRQIDKMAAEINDLDSRLIELAISKADIDRLANDKNHIYTLSRIGENGIIKETDKEIIIRGESDALMIHEIRHVSLWLQTGRPFRFNADNMLTTIVPNGCYDELRAYRAQYAFDPYSLPRPIPNAIKEVSIEYVGRMRQNDGTLVYPQIYQVWQNASKIVVTPKNVKESTPKRYTDARIRQ
jgi:hypothetical protein